MPDYLKKVLPGQRLHIPAAAYNAFVDAALAQRRKDHDLGQGSQPTHRSSGIVLVKNNSDADRSSLDVLGVDGPVIGPADNVDEFKSKLVLSGVLPDRRRHAGKFAVLLEPLANGAIGRAMISGICPALIHFPNQTEWPFAEIPDGAAGPLVPAATGAAQILWHDAIPEEGGTVWAVVRLSNPAWAVRTAIVKEIHGSQGNYAPHATGVNTAYTLVAWDSDEMGKPPEERKTIVLDVADPTDAGGDVQHEFVGLDLYAGDAVRYIPTTPFTGILLNPVKRFQVYGKADGGNTPADGTRDVAEGQSIGRIVFGPYMSGSVGNDADTGARQVIYNADWWGNLVHLRDPSAGADTNNRVQEWAFSNVTGSEGDPGSLLYVDWELAPDAPPHSLVVKAKVKQGLVDWLTSSIVAGIELYDNGGWDMGKVTSLQAGNGISFSNNGGWGLVTWNAAGDSWIGVSVAQACAQISHNDPQGDDWARTFDPTSNGWLGFNGNKQLCISLGRLYHDAKGHETHGSGSPGDTSSLCAYVYLNNLADVNANPQPGDLLMYDGSQWKAATISGDTWVRVNKDPVAGTIGFTHGPPGTAVYTIAFMDGNSVSYLQLDAVGHVVRFKGSVVGR